MKISPRERTPSTYSPWTGLPTLQVGRVSKASATQRAGRAGRTGPGQVVRLYSEEDYLLRPEHDTPEIARADLSQLLLSIRAMKIAHLDDLDWLDAPPRQNVESAEWLLDHIGANGGMEQRLAQFPLSPRLSRILVEALDRGVGEDGCLAAAMLGLGGRSEKNDLLAAMDLPQDYRLRQHTEQLLRWLDHQSKLAMMTRRCCSPSWLAFLTEWPGGDWAIRLASSQ